MFCIAAMSPACAVVSGELPAAAVDSLIRVEVTIPGEGVELAGMLLRPARPGPHPAIVMLPGSGDHSREFAMETAQHLARRGLIVLAYDKRGTGRLSGSWMRASLDDLAADASAALSFVREQGGVMEERIGVWGPSQGSWVATRLVERGARIGFLISVSGGGVGPEDAERYAYGRELAHAGATAADVSRAERLLDRYFAYLRTGKGYGSLSKAIERVRDEPWYAALSLDRVVPSPEGRAYWEWVATFDPAPGIEAMQCPVLLLFGSADARQPTDLAVARWREALARAGNEQVDVRVFAEANHFLQPQGGVAHGHGAQTTALPGEVLDVIDRWLADHVTR
jgi:alpha-beta hydrolase superfamily lysophospholipase